MFKTTALVALLSSITLVNADNTPNLCSDGINNLHRIKPSETGIDITDIPNITVGGETYNGDADHFVSWNDNTNFDSVIVYLPGTTDRPELSSCLIKSMADSSEFPVIGLSYNYLSSGDKFRNAKCATLKVTDGISEQIKCLEEQHLDAIEGGNYGATHFVSSGAAFWGAIDPKNSITARLVKLLEYLDDTTSEKWKKFYRKKTQIPLWKRIIVVGHSQGAGHAAYLANKKKLSGAVMISGPQDECIDCEDNTKFWIDNDYKTKKKLTSFSSGDEELYNVHNMNWQRMSDAGATRWKDPYDVKFATDSEEEYPVCDAPLYTNVRYAATSTCGGKEHCSTAIDDSVPFIEKTDGDKLYLYEIGVWPAIVNGVSNC